MAFKLRIERESNTPYKDYDPLYEVFTPNSVHIGDFLKKDDGYFDFWPISGGGYWSSYLLKALAEELDKLNAEWDKQIREDPAING